MRPRGPLFICSWLRTLRRPADGIVYSMPLETCIGDPMLHAHCSATRHSHLVSRCGERQSIAGGNSREDTRLLR